MRHRTRLHEQASSEIKTVLTTANDDDLIGLGDDAARRTKVFSDRLTQLQQAGGIAVTGQSRPGAFQPRLDMLGPRLERESAGVRPANPEIGRQPTTVRLGELMGAQRNACRLRLFDRRDGGRARNRPGPMSRQKGRVGQIGGNERPYIGFGADVTFCDQTFVG